MVKIFIFFLSVLSIFIYSFPSFCVVDFPFKLAFRPLQSEVQPFRGAGVGHIVYEIYLQNFENFPIRLKSLTARGGFNGQTLFEETFASEKLRGSFTVISEIGLKPQEPVLQPGQGGIIFVFLNFDRRIGPTQEIRHEIQAEKVGDPPTAKTMAGAFVRISAKSIPVVSPPLMGERWWSPNAPANNSIHRRIVIPIDGEIWVPERLAIDWIKLDEKGKSYKGSPDKNENYYAHGAPVHSVADGKVVAVKDGIPENVPQAKEMAVTINMETIGGNHILVDIGNGNYTFYAHLIPGSLKVKVGDRVSRGQEIALLGNTGNSSEPHLHFHIIDRPDPLRGQGIPYVLDTFTRLKTDIKLNDQEDIIHFQILGKQRVENELPMNLEAVNFP